jgi:hypothetical protein
MPMLNEILGELPSGKVAALDDEAVGKHLREHYLHNDAEKKRQAKMAKRLDLFHDRTQKIFEQIVDETFEDPDLKKDRKKFVRYAKFQNVTNRVVEEISTVYDEAAERHAGAPRGDNDKAYQSLLCSDGVRINSQQRIANEYVNLLNEVLEWFVIDNDGEPQLRIWTPDKFWAVSHPLDPIKLIAVIFPIDRMGFPSDPTMPKYQLWSNEETVQIDGRGFIMSATRQEHGLGRMPGVLVHRRPPVSELLDSVTGDDLTSAHEAVALLNIIMVKEQQVGTKIPYVSGDLSETAVGQPMAREHMTVFQEGLTPGTLDLGSNPEGYINTARAVIKSVAANYGIPESVFDLSYQATSGFEISMKRHALKEKRHKQIMDPWTPAERSLAEVMSAVTGKHKQSMHFSTDKWVIDFGEVDTPQDPTAELEYLLKLRTAGVITTEDIIVHYNPEFAKDRKLATEKLKKNIAAETERLELMDTLRATNKAPNAQVGDPTPEENGEQAQVAQPRNGPPPPTVN